MPDFTDNLRPSLPDGPSTLAKERAGSAISPEELGQHLFSTDGFLHRQARILPVVERERLFDKTQQLNLSRVDRFKLALARGKLLRRLRDEHKWDLDDYKMAEYLVDDVSPYMLHLHMFITTVREQASDAQLAHWMPLIESWKIIGAYAQTELGHGSNVQGIELQARWDGQRKEFILHSPTLTASKWWNGTLGRIANHAIVMAQLLLPKAGSDAAGEASWVSHGPHPFIVQVRDMETHQPLDGVVVGDIGPKYGYKTMDNAYMLFNKFHIPHSALLSRYFQIDPETGTYKRLAIPAVVYGTMTYVRSRIVQDARLALARAVTVAVRYTAIRRQFRDRDGDRTGPELSVLDYPTVGIRILPLLASTFALHYTALSMQDAYKRARTSIEAGDFSSLADMHSMSSGLKSLCTTIVSDGIETCRRALGGQGYGGGSGLIQLNNDYLSRPTVEGDNWMITQQVAAYVIKKMTAAVASPESPSANETESRFKEFLRTQRMDSSPQSLDVLNNDEDIVKSFVYRANHLSYNVYVLRMVKKQSWTSLMVQLHKLSQVQSEMFLVSTFYDSLKSNQTLSSPLKAVLLDLYRLFALFTMEKDRYEFLRCGAVSAEQLDALPGRIGKLMGKIRPHGVKLVDSWMIPDYLLDSALGRYDGKVYEALFHTAHRQNPLNQITFNPNYWEDELVKGSGEGWSSIPARL